MKRNEPVSKIMSTDVVTLHHGDTLSGARAMMRHQNIHHLPVIDGHKLLGILTWTDILRVSFGDAFQADERTVDATLDHTLTLEQVMNKEPQTITPDTSIHEAATILADANFHALPVVDAHTGELKGIVTSGDLLRYFCELF